MKPILTQQMGQLVLETVGVSPHSPCLCLAGLAPVRVHTTICNVKQWMGRQLVCLMHLSQASVKVNFN